MTACVISTILLNVFLALSPTGSPVCDSVKERASDTTAKEIYYYHTDHLGSSAWITDSLGLAVQHVCYLPWGENWITQKTGNFNPTFTFSGKERDEETGYSYFGSRYYDSRLSTWLSVDPMRQKYPQFSPFVYCANNPTRLVDPNGMEIEPVYDINGNFLGTTKEGFTGEVLLYLGNDKLDFSSMSKSEIMKNNDITSYEFCENLMTGSAKSNIWSNIVSHFEGLNVYDETFSVDAIVNGGISIGKHGNWATDMQTGEISGTGAFINNYEATVENIASSLIVHEWYSHFKKRNSDRMKSHRLAYKNVINFKTLWDKTTDKYKSFNLNELRKYTKEETGREEVDKPYRRLYNIYGKSYHNQPVYLINETTCNNEQITDSIVVEYWNVWGRNNSDYYIIYSPYKKEIVVYTSWIKTYTGWIKSTHRLVVNSDSALQYFNKAISNFFITKSKAIIEKKSPKNEIICAEYPTLFIDIYNNKGKEIRNAFVAIDEEDYSPIFTIEFAEFIDFINDLTKKHDQMIDRMNNQDTYRCRFK